MSDLRLLSNSQATRTLPSSGASGTTGINNTTSNSNSAMQNRSRAPSDFDLRLMPHDKILKRVLYPWSVHHSLPTSNWIATISRPESFLYPSLPNDPNSTTVRYTQFSFPTEKEARKFCTAYTPPKPIPSVDGTCRMCNNGVGSSSGGGGGGGHQHSRCLLRSCRNCGIPLCDRCSCRWDKRMLPKTYLAASSSSAAGTVRVCKSCDWLSNAFCLSLLQGRYQDALTIHGTGNVNLRSSFADIHREAMFPIHCAVMGGSLELVRWLVETQLCPISVNRDRQTNRMLSVQTSANRTLLDLAMAGGKPRFDILVYLVAQKGLSIDDMKDPSLAPKTLEAILKLGSLGGRTAAGDPDNNTMMINEIDEINLVQQDDSTFTTIEDCCRLCCERSMDCVLQPCGHQCCCSSCGSQLSLCPICKVRCSVLRIYRP